MLKIIGMTFSLQKYFETWTQIYKEGIFPTRFSFNVGLLLSGQDYFRWQLHLCHLEKGRWVWHDKNMHNAFCLIFRQRFWSVLCLNSKAVFQLNIPTKFSSEFSFEYFNWIHTCRILSNWKQPSAYAAAKDATNIG